MRRLLVLTAILAALLVPAAPALAASVNAVDREGRTIAFDVQAQGADVEWYAEVLRGALHGDEISRVTVRVVTRDSIRGTCGADAVACYSGSRFGGTIIVPVGTGSSLAATLLHEYGHHVDASHSVPGVPEPNGTPGWWDARAMAQRLADGDVARDYSSGWDRSIGEVFAEDYVQVHMRARYGIRWLEAPDATVKNAISADLGGAPPAAEPPSDGEDPSADDPDAAPRTVSVVRSGRLRRGSARELPFTLLGPGRSVEVTVRTATGRRGRLRLELVCDGATVATKTLRGGLRRASISSAELGPAECEAVLRNVGTGTARYAVGLRLTRP